MKNFLFVLFVMTESFFCNTTNKKALSSDSVKHPLNRVFSLDTNNSVSQIPIIAWIGIPHRQATLAHYQELRAAGVTESYYPYPNLDAVQAALDLAQKTGTKIFIYCPELTYSPETTVRKFMNHPALAGYFLADEPGSKSFANLATLVKRITSVDTKRPCYVNLLPNYATPGQWGTSTYQEYLDNFVKQVPVPILSFDHYPIIGNTNRSIRSQWYSNLEMVSAEAAKTGKPFYAFALTVAHGPYPVATLGSLRLQVFSDLAYGAQGIEYFTYWTVSDGGKTNYHDAPMTQEGNKTGVYNIMQHVNNEIKGLSGVFLGANVVSVAHTGSDIPQGTVPLKRLPQAIRSLKTDGLGAIVSVMSNHENNYLVVVNRDFTNAMKLTIDCNKGVSKISKDGTATDVGDRRQTINVEPGDVAIYKWTK